MIRLRFHGEAEAEITAAAFWYDEREPGLGDEFLEELDRVMTLIGESSGTWPLWPGLAGSRGIRRCLLSRFPYGVAYFMEEDEAYILAVAHHSRKPSYWLDCLDS
ncbi:type II toxin-antitoxin system RelE/ParE family toxin [Acidimicrobium ferrooxidans]|nr:type II toxin-antitoxin system RelE/ParE family toxin [Acidimicrobium ferrooxidans]